MKAGARQAVLDACAAALPARETRPRGEAVFARLCTGCHKFGGKGHEVGPDLAALTDRSAEALRIAILDPNREVDARYAGFTAALKDGRVVTGLMASETGNAITLKRQEGQADVILRADLEELKTSGKSLMPEGLENDLKGSDLADLMAYVASGGERPKVLAGNHPELVTQGADGSVRLSAATAEIRGETLTFETEYRQPRPLEERERPRRLDRQGRPAHPVHRLDGMGVRGGVGRELVPDPRRREDHPRPRGRDRRRDLGRTTVRSSSARLRSPRGPIDSSSRPMARSATPCSTCGPSCSALGGPGRTGRPR